MKQSEIVGAGTVLRNKDGELIFSIKRKESFGDYFIFEIHWDRMGDGKEDFELIWKKMKAHAKSLDVVLFDIDEIGREMEAAVMLAGTDHPEGHDNSTDVQIAVTNHADGTVHSLFVGMWRPSEKEIEEIKFP